MSRLLFPLALAVLALAGPAWSAEPLSLRAEPRVDGPAITLGDLFENAGDAAGHAVAPAPAPGRSTSIPVRVAAAAAAAVGRSWTPPDALTAVVVTRNGPSRPTTSGEGDMVIRRGDIVALTYAAPGLRLSTRARAVSDAARGEPVRLVNLQSQRPIDGVAEGPGRATIAGVAP